jgi:DNA-binding transcriptional ArsR family regulator
MLRCIATEMKPPILCRSTSPGDGTPMPIMIPAKDTRRADSKAANAEAEALQRTRRIQRAAALLKQASDPTRLQVISMLSRGERHVGSMCEELTQNQPALGHHLALLRHGGIITPRRRGKNQFYHLTGAGVRLSQVVKRVFG